MYGPRNDQPDRAAQQKAYGADLRVAVAGLYVNAEYVRVDEEQGGPEDDVAGRVPVLVRRSARAAATSSSRTR